ncbi:putative phosphatidate phosphatase [Chironomus tepperi]|uniref:putative phosphatidate phosphatase n=1 Tax=Chironomus tepperi TaxID=113505 RepID=UPI00391F7BF3
MFVDKIMLKVLTDAIIIAIPAIIVAVFETWPIQPFHSGFYCNDHSIMYPYKKNESVPGTEMEIYGTLAAALLIVITEIILLKCDASYGNNSKTLKLLTWKIPPYVQNLYKFNALLLLSETINRCISDGMKLTVGKLRPHFMDHCKPVLSDGTTCADPQNFNKYILDYTCSNEEATISSLREIRMSFPSGHANFSFVTALFCVFYLEYRVKHKGSKVWKLCVQLILITAAIYISLTRITDFKHSYSDVATGVITGCLLAYVICYHVSDFSRKAE